MIPFNPELPSHRAPRVLIEYIQADDPGAVDYFARELGRRGRAIFDQSAREDLTQELWIASMRMIKSNAVQDPDALWGYVRSIARHIHAAWVEARMRERRKVICIDEAIHGNHDQFTADRGIRTLPPDARPTPIDEAMAHELDARIEDVIAQLCPRDREIVERFYFGGQNREQIEQEMHLTETQVRLFKSRALKRLREAFARRARLRGLPRMEEIAA